MVKFNFNPLGVRYQEGLRHIHIAYSSSYRALDEQLDSMIGEQFTYQERLERGEVEWVGERDEDGHLLWSQEQLNDAAVDECAQSIPTLNKGFIPVLYHHWERGARLLIAVHRPPRNPEGNAWKYIREHSELAALLVQLGVTVDPKLDTLVILNNALKHNNARYGRLLLQMAPHMFWRSYDPDDPSSDLYTSIGISRDHIKEFIAVVGRSGASSDTVIRSIS